ncbi:ABC transporter ATP-binding protein [Stella sp.]|uniref:ABC transporter ATP-binding protein n=1 Tax=Stella sp. TaxID=2912054 RepID=UPI0035B10884
MGAFIEVRNLAKHYPVRRGSLLKAVDGLDFDIRRGEVLGLVGESGCGKSTVGRLMLRLLPPTAGSIRFDGADLTALGHEEMRRMRRRMQIVFQDPYSSLNPRMTIGATLTFPMRVQRMHRGEEADRAAALLARVGLDRSAMNRYPHEFSGGQLQRVGIARALAVEPDFIVADEPVSALDVSIQSQVLNLFKDLQEELQLTSLFISHDLSVVEFLCDRVAVLYMGRLAEVAPARTLFSGCRHPYTESLLGAILHPDPDLERAKPPLALRGEISTPIDPPPGCRFQARCPHRMEICRQKDPPLVTLGEGHQAACWLHADANAAVAGGATTA